jgi:large subunit ribosomal protein L2
MAIAKMKPTSPGRRFMVKVTNPDLYRGEPMRQLVEKKTRTGGRNNAGRVSVRHQGGGHKQRYRIVDFKRRKQDIPATVERFEYDPNRSAHLALLKYADGEWAYVLAPKGLKAGDTVIASETAPIAVGNCLPLRNIPVGTEVHGIELRPGKGAQLARSAGTSVQLVAREGHHATLRLRSGRCGRCTPSAGPSSAPSATASTACRSSARPVRRGGAVCGRRCAVSS